MGKSGNLFNDVVNKNVVMGVMVLHELVHFMCDGSWCCKVWRVKAMKQNECASVVMLYCSELGATLRGTPHVDFIDSDSVP